MLLPLVVLLTTINWLRLVITLQRKVKFIGLHPKRFVLVEGIKYMKCKHCENLIKGEPITWKHKTYTLESCDFGKDVNPKYFHFCSIGCRQEFLKDRAKFFDDLDEVMNRNKHFQREEGMQGYYVDGDKKYPVSAYWKKDDITGQVFFPRLDIDKIEKFHNWLYRNNLVYKYESR